LVLAHPNLLFQVTVAAKHPIKQAGLHDILGVMNPSWDCRRVHQIFLHPPQLFFVVPQERFSDFELLIMMPKELSAPGTTLT